MDAVDRLLVQKLRANARVTYADLVGDLEERRLPEGEQRAAAAVLRTLDALSGLDSLESVADLALLDLTLDLELSGDLPRHGRIGDGVLVAPLAAAIASSLLTAPKVIDSSMYISAGTGWKPTFGPPGRTSTSTPVSTPWATSEPLTDLASASIA